MQDQVRVLLIEDDEDDYILTRDLLAEEGRMDYQLDWIKDYTEAVDSLSINVPYDVYLVDYYLGAENGFNFIKTAKSLGIQAPFILLTGLGSHSLDLKAMEVGAADYLDKSEMTPRLLERAIRYARERQFLVNQLERQSLTDEMTGVYNRRGFVAMAEQQLLLAQRTKQPLVFIFADVDGLKKINDTYGHLDGDIAIVRVAQALKQTLRESDIIGRIGGDEFGVIAINSGEEQVDILESRISSKFDEVSRDLPYRVRATLGSAVYQPGAPCSLDKLMAKADHEMYLRKDEARGKLHPKKESLQ